MLSFCFVYKFLFTSCVTFDINAFLLNYLVIIDIPLLFEALTTKFYSNYWCK